MSSAEVVELPRDRKGRTMRLGYEVLIFNGTSTCGQGEVTSLTLAMMVRDALRRRCAGIRMAHARRRQGRR